MRFTKSLFSLHAMALPSQLVACRFGHTSLWSIFVDPFGILEALSLKLNTSLCPFYGRWGLPLGPPRRKAVTVAFGEPVVCPSVPRPARDATDQQRAEYDAIVAEHHTKMLASFKGAFDNHKVAAGEKCSELQFV